MPSMIKSEKRGPDTLIISASDAGISDSREKEVLQTNALFVDRTLPSWVCGSCRAVGNSALNHTCGLCRAPRLAPATQVRLDARR